MQVVLELLDPVGHGRLGREHHVRPCGTIDLANELEESDMKRKLNKNLSGNAVYYTACSLLVISKNSCSKLHCQKGLDLVLFSHRITVNLHNQLKRSNLRNEHRGLRGKHQGRP